VEVAGASAPRLGLTVSFYTDGEIVGTWPLLWIPASTAAENPLAVVGVEFVGLK